MKNLKKSKSFLIVSMLLLVTGLYGQNKIPLDHSVYDSWKNLRSAKISDDGRWVSYEINPQVGDGFIYLYEVATGKLDSVARGYQGSFMPGNDFFIFRIKPQYRVTRKAKKEKKKPGDMPKDSLGIFDLETHALTKIPRLKSFKVPLEEGGWFAYQLEKIYPEKSKSKKEPEMSEEEQKQAKEKSAAYKKEMQKVKKAKGSDLVLLNPAKDKKHVFHNVTGYTLSAKGGLAGIMVQTKDSIDHTKIIAFETPRESSREIWSREGTGKSLIADKQGSQLAFMFTGDTVKRKLYNLVYWKASLASAKSVVDSVSAGMPENWNISEYGRLWFSESGNRLYFGTATKPELEKKDTLLKEEQYSLDIWSWTDPLMQPMQKVNLNRELHRTYQAVWIPETGKMIQLATETIPNVSVTEKGDGQYALGTSGLPYRKLISWDANRYQDVYLVDVTTAQTRLMLKKASSRVSLSPHGRYLLWYAVADSAWYCRSVASGETRNLTGNLPVAFYNELHDTPSDPRPYGTGGWIGDDDALLIYDAFDIWKLDPAGKKNPVNITAGMGRKENIRFRVVTLDREKETIPPKAKLLLSAFHRYNKKSGFYTKDLKKSGVPEKLFLNDFSYFPPPVKAKNADQLIWRRSTFQVYPDLWLSDLNFNNAKKISFANPQQSKYLWGTVELVEWTAYDQQKLQGLLYKPENFDPHKKYPMIVYFYERSSDGLHRHTTPGPWRSTINKSYMVSNGYLVFVPDIPYKIGYPGESAFNAVVSGTMSLIQKYPFVDKDHIGVNGHSWGGYQIAYLVTRTNLFAAAYCGAPVVNMTSAYGGIRWASGMSREFQYEQTQSRIGGTLWEKPMQYFENSPLFFVPKIQTPVMFIHNDNDGAVPWYQGIEFFSALRRLNKPAWMLVYNGEGHGLSKRPDMKDLTIREVQFYDHYLKGKPAPDWMVHGLPAIDKGKKDAYELMNDKMIK